MQTPSASRRQLPPATSGRYNHTLAGGMGHSSLRQGTPMQTSQNFGRATGPGVSYGMSAHAKFGRPPVPPLSRSGYGTFGAGKPSY